MGAYDEAMTDLQAGRGAAGDRRLLDHLARLRAEHGEGIALAEALSELAQYRMNAGDLQGCVEAMATAVAIPLPDEHRGHALALALNYGELLSKTGRAAEAIPVLVDNVAGRVTLYGERHAAVAFARIPLGASLFGVGRKEDALAELRQATAILWDEGNARFGQAIAHLALIEGPQVFEGVAGTSTAVHEDLVWALEVAIPEVEPEARISALGGAAEWLDVTGYGAGQARLKALAVITNVARAAALHQPRVSAFLQMHEIARRRGDQGLAVQTVLGLALAESEAGDLASAEASYNLADTIAGELGVDVESDVQRNFGLFLAEIGRISDAETALRRSVEAADASEVRGIAEMSYGIFVQHQGRTDEAALLLKSGLDKLPANHPDRVYGEVHLQALRERRSCGCGESSSIDADLTQLVRAQLPEGLIDGVTLVNGEPNVQLLRHPTAEEMDLIRAAVNQGWAELRRRLGA